ncbi:MAG TPA: DUF4339 domain-containing protein [Clostridia bacterium]|nr:DUF4339 domain-containing protein [Clostridia bacterium]
MYKINSESIGDVKKYVWHYRKDNKEHGPFTYEDIVEMVKKGEIGPEDYLLKFGNRKFFKASEVQGLFDEIGQPEPEQEEQKEEVLEEQTAVIKEEPKEDTHMVFENRTVYPHTKQSNESSGSRIIMIAAGLLGLCLAIWVLMRLF